MTTGARTARSSPRARESLGLIASLLVLVNIACILGLWIWNGPAEARVTRRTPTAPTKASVIPVSPDRVALPDPSKLADASETAARSKTDAASAMASRITRAAPIHFYLESAAMKLLGRLAPLRNSPGLALTDDQKKTLLDALIQGLGTCTDPSRAAQLDESLENTFERLLTPAQRTLLETNQKRAIPIVSTHVEMGQAFEHLLTVLSVTRSEPDPP
ncbi:MAG: hypothetical protein EB084_05060 [Proteobacteria bacterium]|nr:hypothetical protein [Pseudomonadota bacterium]